MLKNSARNIRRSLMFQLLLIIDRWAIAWMRTTMWTKFKEFIVSLSEMHFWWRFGIHLFNSNYRLTIWASHFNLIIQMEHIKCQHGRNVLFSNKFVVHKHFMSNESKFYSSKHNPVALRHTILAYSHPFTQVNIISENVSVCRQLYT